MIKGFRIRFGRERHRHITSPAGDHCIIPSNYCEQGSGLMGDDSSSCGGDFSRCCASECRTDIDCALLGIPESPDCCAGACVPIECNGSFSAYFSLRR